MTADEFRSWRKACGLTQEKAAEALGRSLAWVKSVEAGRRKVGRTCTILCQLLDRSGDRGPRIYLYETPRGIEAVRFWGGDAPVRRPIGSTPIGEVLAIRPAERT